MSGLAISETPGKKQPSSGIPSWLPRKRRPSELDPAENQAAAKIKETLGNAAAGHVPSHGEIQSGLAHVKELLKRAHTLASQ